MNRLEKLEFYGVACLAAVLPPALLAGILLLPAAPDRSCYPVAVPPAAWYFPRPSRQAARASSFEDAAAFRGVYAPDIFASFREYPLPGGKPERGRDELPGLQRLAAPASFSAPVPAAVSRAAEDGRGKAGIDMGDPSDLCARPAAARAPARAGAVQTASIVMGGSLKNRRFEQPPLRDLVVPAGGKPWSSRAEICFDSSGWVEHVFAEPEGCSPDLCREIVSRLYRARIAEVTASGGGPLSVSYPSSGGNREEAGAAGDAPAR